MLLREIDYVQRNINIFHSLWKYLNVLIERTESLFIQTRHINQLRGPDLGRTKAEQFSVKSRTIPKSPERLKLLVFRTLKYDLCTIINITIWLWDDEIKIFCKWRRNFKLLTFYVQFKIKLNKTWATRESTLGQERLASVYTTTRMAESY